MESRLLNLQEMAAYLRVSAHTLSAHLNEVPHENINGQLYFQKAAVYKALEVNGPRSQQPECIAAPAEYASVVYLIHAKGTCFYKIGVSSSGVEKRVQSMQTSCPHKLVIISTRPGDIGLESLLHTCFSRQRVRGEWFRFNEPKAVVIEKFLAHPIGW